MGRSKFPGKPTKHVNRKRINVLPPTAEGISECNGLMTAETVAENKQVREGAHATNQNVSVLSGVKAKNSLRKRLDRKMQNSKASHSNNPCKCGIISKLCSKSGVKTVANKVTLKNKITCSATRKTSLKRRSVHGYTSVNNFKQCRNVLPKDSNNLVGKFVLPTRSVHSSRVIKPNKRFINVDLSDTLTLKKKVLNKRSCLKEDESQSKSESKSSLVAHPSTKTFPNGRVVLRQARLKLHNQTPTGSDGPFSSKSVNGSPPGTVTCGVCGAVRFYRFVKQARKFNIYSCESCRKFISKMIKRQTCGKNISSATLVCHKGQGMCHVPPIVRSQQMKLIRCAYRSRCPACWLKMCLRSFQMPLSLKNSLAELLPKNMQGSDVIFNNSLPLLWQVNVQNVEKEVSKHPENNQNERIKRPIRFKNRQAVSQTNTVSVTSDVKRQKIDLKGPRVKHVCRSASIVLGQPVATFPVESDLKKNESREQTPDVEKLQNSKTNSNTSDISQSNNKDINSSENESSDIEKLILSEASHHQIKSDRSHRVPFSVPSLSSSPLLSSSSSSSSTSSCLSSSLLSYENKLNIGKKPNLQAMPNTISIDYWSNYDLDDGFCLIATQQFPMPSICLHCGSAGREALLHCSVCCEPYHPYCLEQSPPISTNNRQFLWLCPRCTSCSVCNLTDRQKLNCQKCWKAFHSECFNAKWADKDKSIICSKCLACKGCGEENSTKFRGNLPLCIVCFKLRRVGNTCPICKESKETEIDEKVLECTKCRKWIHAKCEGLSEEHYYILSILPESVKFLCNICSKQSTSTPHWRKAVESELKFNFNRVLRLLSKNKTAKVVLKSNNPDLSTKTSVKRISSNYDERNDDNYERLVTEFISDDNDKTVSRDSFIHCKTSQRSPTVLHIKSKLIWNEYHSVRDFNQEMEEALTYIHSEEVLNIYRMIFKSVFPWFKPSQTGSEKDIDLRSIDKERTYNFTNSEEDVCDQIECIAIDSRYCSFCKSIGDGLSHLESRLLYCGQNEWVHINCALWSSEVYEEIDGSLQNVHSALSRGRVIRCSYCKQKGATVDCYFTNCRETYHFICARTAKCYFTHEKTIYCCSHELPKSSSVIVTPTDFNIRRPVFVEMSDMKKGNFSQIEKVNVMVGSLCVTNLGKINPLLSDSFEAIIPTGYNCSRLFWSTIEPWRLVSYKISTSVLNAHMNNSHVDRNFTVDHTLPKPVVERKLKEIYVWHKEIDKKKSDVNEFEDEEEPQNGADLLSPEITDAIFEELPHELLDGISVQDIFPKLMSYEDFISMDCKSETNGYDVANTDIRKVDGDGSVEMDVKECRSKYEISPETVNKNKSHQKSCSLTVSCKLDSSFSPVMKKRKIAPRENSVFFKLLQVDGNFDDSSSDCGSPTETFKLNIWDSTPSEEPVTCDRCQCTYRTQASYKRHLSECEVICTSESDSELNQDQDSNTNINFESTNLTDNSTVNDSVQPVVIASYESYQNEVHTSILNTETFVTSKSSSELISVSQNSDVINVSQVGGHKSNVETNITCNISTLASQTPVTESVNNETFTIGQPVLPVHESVPLTTNQSTPFCLNSTVPLCVNPPIAFQPNATLSVNPTSVINTNTPILNHAIAINQTGSLSVNQAVQPPLEFQPPAVTIQSLPYPSNVTPIINVTPQSQITFTDKLLNNSNIINSVITQGINVPANRWVKPIEKPSVFSAQKPKTGKGRGRLIAAKRNHVEDNETIIIPPTNSSTPSMVVQHLPSSTFIPTFVDNFQQQATGHNLQYITTITPQISSAIQPQPLVQFQADSNLISLLPGLQQTMIVQQPRVLENQLILDNSGSLSWTPQQVQPVYYGFETIVQNTVLQSQQFLPSTVPGVLTANSSYSTTTQVFQTSKLEPVLDMAANSFLLVNPGQLVNSHSIEVSQNTQSQSLNTITDVVQNAEVNSHKYTPTTFQKADNPVSSVNGNSISLPSSTFISEQGIPTNIVTPTPKSLPTTSQSRPMSRVLPMQTVKEAKPTKVQVDRGETFQKETKMLNKVQEPVTEFEEKKTSEISVKNPVQIHLENDRLLNVAKKGSPIKLVFQKQSEDGSYKISKNLNEKAVHFSNQTVAKANNFNCKPALDNSYKINNNFNSRNSPVQVAPLKPIKSNFIQSKPAHILSLSDKQNRQQDKIEKKIPPESAKHYYQEKKENENVPSILYTIETQDGFKYSSTSITDLWAKVFEAVQNARAAHNMPLLPPDSTNILNSLKILGLKTSGLKYLIEQLPGATKCTKYRPSFNFPSTHTEIEDELIGHSSGSARCAPHIKKNEPYDMFRWLASKHRKPEYSLLCSELIPRRSSINNLPMAMRFRQLKLTSKYSVGVYRSQIHRRGLFCLRDFEAGEMVIEYSGEVIRSILTDKREKFYNSKGIGCYMFRIDDNLVVDATMTGNAARFINHSCDPNCYSKVVEILGHKHIIIFALRKIICGEELTYDYKFPIEEDKIPCTCGARRCRKFLN